MKHIIKAGCTAGVKMLFANMTWLGRYSRHPEKTPFEKRYKRLRKICGCVLRQLNVDTYVTGLENIPEEAVCFFPNHHSAFDALAIITTLDKNTTFVCKKEIGKYFILGNAARSINAEFIDREDLRQSLKLMSRVKDDLAAGNKSWIIFPEGTRSKDIVAPLLPFHHGSFKPAMSAGVPIVPIALYGSFRALKTKPEFKRYPVQIAFLKPIMPDEYKGKTTAEVAEMVQQRIQAEITFKLRLKDHELMTAQKSKKYKPNLIY